MFVQAQVQDLPEAREFQLERLLSIMASIVAVTEAGTKAANSMGSTELFAQVRQREMGEASHRLLGTRHQFPGGYPETCTSGTS